jgi:hypothetical protein
MKRERERELSRLKQIMTMTIVGSYHYDIESACIQ